jgi:hypothetical protein
VGVDRFLEHRKVVPPAHARGGRSHVVEIEQAPERRLVHDVGQLLDRQDIGEVDDRPRDGRHGDAVPLGDVVGVEGVAAMDAHAVDAHPPGRDDRYVRGGSAKGPRPPGG